VLGGHIDVTGNRRAGLERATLEERRRRDANLAA
jgi:hypothetical protein